MKYEWVKENWFKLGSLLCAFIVALSAGYYYVIFLPQEARLKTETGLQKLEIKTENESPDKEAQDIEQRPKSAPESSQLKMKRCDAQAKMDGKAAFTATMDEQVTCNPNTEMACFHDQYQGALPYADYKQQEEYDRSYAECLSS